MKRQLGPRRRLAAAMNAPGSKISWTEIAPTSSAAISSNAPSI
jgi:hypothetical protein